jgi:hypothetical protein
MSAVWPQLTSSLITSVRRCIWRVQAVGASLKWWLMRIARCNDVYLLTVRPTAATHCTLSGVLELHQFKLAVHVTTVSNLVGGYVHSSSTRPVSICSP